MKQFFKDSTNKMILGAIVLIIAATAVITIIIDKKPALDFVSAKKADITESISTTGVVRSSQDLSLSFKTGGTVASIKVSAGDRVKKNQTLIALDGKDALNAISQAEASLNAAQANYDKIKNGATADQINVAQTAVNTAQTNLNNAQSIADKNINSKYSYALNVLDDAYIKMYNAYSEADLIQRTYFTQNDQEEFIVMNSKNYEINKPMNDYKTTLDTAKASKDQASTDVTISQAITSLNRILNALTVIRNTCDSTSYQSRVSVADKAALDLQKSYISAAQTAISQLQNDISTLKTQNDNTVKSSQSALSQAEASLTLLQSPTRPEDIAAAEAQVEASSASLQKARNAYADSIITSPMDGLVTDIKPNIGEIVGAGSPVVSMISLQKLQIETYVSENDLGKINIGDAASVTLDAYGSSALFDASVISIDPAATASKGIPTYKIISEFAGDDARIKTGMSANVTIIDAKHPDTIAIPAGAVIEDNGQTFVMMKDANKIQKRQIKTGLSDSNGYVEVLSGLNEGDQVASFGK